MTSNDYRRIALDNLEGNWGTSVLVGLVAALLGGVVTGSSMFNINIDAEQLSKLPKVIVQYFALMASIGSFLGIVQFIIGGVVNIGYAQYLLNQYNRAQLDIHELFSRFDRFKEGFLQSFLRGLYIVLWSLLFIIPGIIKSYSYAMTPFIMAENPDITAKEAIEASKQLMDGHKGELFMLDLSFIGWTLLAALTLNIGTIFLNPYKNAAYAAFYKELTAPKAEF